MESMADKHPYEIREHRFRLQQRIEAAEDGPDKEAMEAELAHIRETCPHAHPEEDPEKGWRCRDCDDSRPPEPEEEEQEEEQEDEAETAAAS